MALKESRRPRNGPERPRNQFWFTILSPSLVLLTATKIYAAFHQSLLIPWVPSMEVFVWRADGPVNTACRVGHQGAIRHLVECWVKRTAGPQELHWDIYSYTFRSISPHLPNFTAAAISGCRHPHLETITIPQTSSQCSVCKDQPTLRQHLPGVSR